MTRKGSSPGELRPLIEVAAQLGMSYNVLLRAVMTRAVRGERRGRSWLADAQDAARWRKQQAVAMAGVNAENAGDTPARGDGT